jgi:ATP-dependent RNA helicase DHX36
VIPIRGPYVLPAITQTNIRRFALRYYSRKTTQVPQLVLDSLILQSRGSEANIIVTQPRRISAIGVSERISSERCERVGETCGYSIKLEKKMSRKTRLLLCTTGILLRRLQCDPDLASVSHVFVDEGTSASVGERCSNTSICAVRSQFCPPCLFVDEVHERDLNTDFLLIILKDLLARRKSLKLVLMSATLNSDAFSAFFNVCAIVSIPGRAHPVQEFRLEDILQLTEYEVQERSDYAVKSSNATDRLSKSALRQRYAKDYNAKVIQSLSIVDETVINYELLADLLEHIALESDEGAILVFLPGFMEITKAIDEMHRKPFFQSPQVIIHPLHSSLSTSEQTAVFVVPPSGVRKVVVATNIAETSITIEGKSAESDTGYWSTDVTSPLSIVFQINRRCIRSGRWPSKGE